MACDKQILEKIRSQADDKHLAMFYCYVYFKKINKQPLADMFDDADYQKCVDYSNSVCDNEKVTKSIRTCLASAPNISKGTIAYNSVQIFK
ncbi:MAG: hypothetical protein LUG95_07070 [Clostridiales bacterium]|nr:hypothetical protein [Clostridiales bacterium]